MMSRRVRRQLVKAAADERWSNYWSVDGADVARALKDPGGRSSSVRTLADMTPQERAEIERVYCAKVKA